MIKLWVFGFILLLSVMTCGLYSKDSKIKYAMHDDEAYNRFCEEIIQEPKLYTSFRSHPLYAIFQESLNQETAQICLAYVEKHYPQLLQDAEFLESLDAIGNPPKVKRASGQEVSYPTLRNLKIAGDIAKHFGMFTGKNIVQIGASDGTLCAILKKFHRSNHYCIVDLPSALQLAQKTLVDLGVKDIQFCSLEEFVTSSPIDLVVSPFVFSESNRRIQEIYLSRILRNASQAYLECRFPMQHFGLKTWMQSQIMERLKGIGKEPWLLEEGPITDLGHCQILYRS